MFKHLLFGIMIKGEKILIQMMNLAFVFMWQKEKMHRPTTSIFDKIGWEPSNQYW